MDRSLRIRYLGSYDCDVAAAGSRGETTNGQENLKDIWENGTLGQTSKLKDITMTRKERRDIIGVGGRGPDHAATCLIRVEPGMVWPVGWSTRGSQWEAGPERAVPVHRIITYQGCLLSGESY
ncbi:hypothetical protein VTN00DRAFT_5477 [Thermoascus crustaceus]|uniref:uncharacterized protein n=1 Tax=Thermoascus crustaceus TaxID=5088 RepID=UPI003744089F